MNNKVLILGIDSFDPRVVEFLDLPNLKSMKTYNKLETTIPPETPVAWSAAATGMNPGEFGIFDFLSRDAETYMPRLNLAHEKRGIVKTSYVSAMKGTPFWKILSTKNIPTTIIRWPLTFPAEPIRGKMLSGLGVVDIKGMLNSYSFYTSNVVQQKEDMTGNIIKVSNEDRIETYISGPLIKKAGNLTDTRAALSITKQKDHAILHTNGCDYRVREREWSHILHVAFKVYFSTIHGICQAYLVSLDPFNMYLTSVQVDPENQVVPITYPKEYGQELVENQGLFYTLGICEDTKAVQEGHLPKNQFLRQVQQIEEEREKMFYYEYKRFKEGVLAVVFDAGDRLKHIYWEDHDVIPQAIASYYHSKDKLIGDVLSTLDEKTPLFVLSDHGFEQFKKAVNINTWLVEAGYMKTTKEKGTLFNYVDWSKTRAYALGFTSIYINEEGREKEGIISTKDKESLINDLVKDLQKIRDHKQKIFTNVYKAEEIYSGKHKYLAPDIVLGYRKGYRMSDNAAIGGLDPDIIFDNTKEWKGDHLMDRSHVPGVLFTNFPINKKQPSILDIAPTIFSFFKIEHNSMDGSALR